MKIPTFPTLWRENLKDEFNKEYFISLIQFLKKQRKKGLEVYPSDKNIFRAYLDNDLDKIKVVILGQDPYHGEGQAHGLSFSVEKTCKIPPSLKNIYNELNTDTGIELPKHGFLSQWSKEGVFLLNTVLTVEKSKPGSHRKKGWEEFTDKTIKILNAETENLVFILWGAPAQKKEKLIDSRKHLILKAPHPSPLSSYRGFFGSRPFSKTNKYLKEKKIKEIDWKIS